MNVCMYVVHYLVVRLRRLPSATPQTSLTPKDISANIQRGLLVLRCLHASCTAWHPDVCVR